ncbi:hypothetical protein KIPB_004494 [Kipferlia bialata]|uniref:Guanylate cyclase domain-containing protein n=1 Tax=Kipferlia bialata TaxID=797122 RepID=A0A9K3CVS8_9EUKA|nr:hypothetical protein KIPB_004494 [Kipferlia bialata]|eukprot:g4494.t1
MYAMVAREAVSLKSETGLAETATMSVVSVPSIASIRPSIKPELLQCLCILIVFIGMREFPKLGGTTRVFMVGEVGLMVCNLQFMLESRKGQISRGSRWYLLGTLLLTVGGALWELKHYEVPSVLSLSAPLLAMVSIHTWLVWRSTAHLETSVDRQVVRLNRAIDASMGVFCSSLPSGTREYVTAPDMQDASPSGCVTFEAYSVIAFIGTTPASSNSCVPTAQHISDLVLLTSLLDELVTMSEGSVEKVKGADGTYIVVSRATSKEGSELAAWDIVTFCSIARVAFLLARSQYFPMTTLKSLRSGVSLGPITEGVLGERELMYDVFGDTVNTAARLMSKAGDWDLLVSEDVANAVSSVADRDGCRDQHSLMGSDVYLEYVCTRPSINFLKGKGLFPCRHVHLSEACMAQTQECLGEILSGVLGGMVDRHQTWTERMLAPAQYMLRHLGTRRRGERSTSTPYAQSGSDIASTEYIADTIVHRPWHVIRARFADLGTLKSGCNETQDAYLDALSPADRVSSVPFLGDTQTLGVREREIDTDRDVDGLGGSRKSNTATPILNGRVLGDLVLPTSRLGKRSARYEGESSGSDTGSEGGIDDECTPTQSPRAWGESTPESPSVPLSESESSSIGAGYGGAEESLPVEPYTVTDTLTREASDPASLLGDTGVSRVSTPSSSWLSRTLGRARDRTWGVKSAKEILNQPCPDIQSLDGQLLDDLQRVHQRVTSTHGPTGRVPSLPELTEVVWNKEPIDPMRRLILMLRVIPTVCRMSFQQSLGDTSVFLVMHTLLKLRRKCKIVTLLNVCQLLLVTLGYIASNFTEQVAPIRYHILETALEDEIALRAWHHFQHALMIHGVISLVRLFVFPYSVKKWSTSILRLLGQALFPEGPGEITGYRDVRKEYRRVNVAKVVTQLSTVALITYAARELSVLISRSTELGISDMPMLGSYGMTLGLMALNECIVALFALNDVDSVVVVCISLLLHILMSFYLKGMSMESSLVFVPALLVTLFALIVSINQVANMCVSLRQLVETLAGQTLVGRVASGRYFSRILSPVIAKASGLFDVSASVFRKDAIAFVTKNKAKPSPAGVEGTVIVSMLYDQVRSLTNEVCGVAVDPLPETQKFLKSYYKDLTVDPLAASGSGMSGTLRIPEEEKHSPLHIREREILALFREWYPVSVSASAQVARLRATTPGRLSFSESSDPGMNDTFMGMRGTFHHVHQAARDHYEIGSDTEASDYLPPDALSVSDTEDSQGMNDMSEPTRQKERDAEALMRRHEISLFPLCVYVKLDIVGFTSFCQQHSSDHVVATLKTLFSGLDDLVLSRAGIGVTKVKTIGDAYEVMRAFTAAEMATLTVDSVLQSISDMASFSLQMVRSCETSFSVSGSPLHVRCGLAVGPAFACVIGSVRVSYDIFGLAPSRARLMEELSPVGCVTVSSDVYELLSAAQAKHPRFGSLRPMRSTSVFKWTNFAQDADTLKPTPTKEFMFGDVVSKSEQSTAAVKGFTQTAQNLLDVLYHPAPGDATEDDIERAERALQCLVDRSCPETDPTHDSMLMSKRDPILYTQDQGTQNLTGVVLVGETDV